MELPYVPVTSPESQMDIVADFCSVPRIRQF